MADDLRLHSSSRNAPRLIQSPRITVVRSRTSLCFLYFIPPPPPPPLSFVPCDTCSRKLNDRQARAGSLNVEIEMETRERTTRARRVKSNENSPVRGGITISTPELRRRLSCRVFTRNIHLLKSFHAEAGNSNVNNDVISERERERAGVSRSRYYARKGYAKGLTTQ